MKLTIELTDRYARAWDGTVARVWEGRTEGGVPCVVFVSQIAVPDYLDESEFRDHLIEGTMTNPQLPAGTQTVSRTEVLMDFHLKHRPPDPT